MNHRQKSGYVGLVLYAGYIEGGSAFQKRKGTPDTRMSFTPVFVPLS